MTPPTLPVITQSQELEAHARLVDLRVHRSEPAAGWSPVLQAYCLGQMWYWMGHDGEELSTLVPVWGNPYTQSAEAFNAYLEHSNEH